MQYIKPGLKLCVKVACSVGFFVVLFSFVNANELYAVFSQVHPGYFLFSFALTPVMLTASCMKWKLILDKGGVKVPLLSLLRIYLIGYFFSNILPSTVGGDVVRSFYAGKKVNNQAYAAVSVFLERFTGILLLCVLVVVMPLLRSELYKNPFVYVPAVGAFSVLIICTFLYVNSGATTLLQRFLNWCLSLLKSVLYFLIPGKRKILDEKLSKIDGAFKTKAGKVKAGMQTAVSEFGKNRKFFLQVILLTVVFYFLTMLNVYISFKAFSVDVDFTAVCVLVPTALFVAHVPVTLLGNLGYFESIFVGYFLLIGVPGAESLAMGLLLRLKMLSLGVIGMGVYLSYRGSKTGEAQELDTLISTSSKEA